MIKFDYAELKGVNNMKTGKRVLSIFLATLMVVLVVPVVPVVHAAAPEFDYSSMGAADGTGSADDFSNGGTQGGIIQFGAYPQTKETDSAIVSALNDCADNWISYGYYSGSGSTVDGQMQPSDYMQYCDVKYGDNKYRGVTFSQYRPWFTGYTSSASHTYQDNYGYNTETTYWFKYEPLQWKVLDPSEGLVLCVSLIDSQPYNNYVLSSGTDPRGNTAFWGDAGKNHYANDYANSSLRKWLNETFYATAFTEGQQNRIAKNHNHQNNDGYYTLAGITNYTDCDSDPTNDKIFLLSCDEINDSSFGFSSSYPAYDDTARQAKGTDYAKCQGLGVFSSASYPGNSWRWLRSPGGSSNIACRVDNFGASNHYISVSCTDHGVRPACVISNLSSGANEPTAEEYILKHLAFASATTMPDSFGFYNKVWNEENGRRLGWAKAWEVVGDIGELISFKFNDLEISADYYDLFLSDIILKLTEKSFDKLELKAFECFNDIYEPIKNILKTTEEWTNSVESGSQLDLDIDGFLLDPDYNMSYGSFIRLNDILGEAFTKHSDLFNQVFVGLNNASTLCEYITDAADIVQAFRESYKAYAITKAFQQINNEFFIVMYRAANQIDNQQYANWFKNALNKYFDMAENGDAVYEQMLSLCKDMGQMTFDRILKDSIKNITYKAVANLLGCPSGYLAIAAFTYNLTYGILDKVCSLNKMTNAYEIMTYIAPVEKAMCELEDGYAAVLIGSQTLESAQNYDFFYNLYKQVNLYLYQAAYDFTVGTKLRKNKATELEVLTMCTDQWKRSSCHPGMSDAVAKKFSGIYCPVDVFAYDAEGNVLLEIINDEIVTCDESITALTFDGKKSIIYPADQDYTIRIVAREEGNMSYYVSEIQEDTSLRQLEFYGISISENQAFTGNIPEAFDVNKSDYALSSDETVIICNYDSAAQNTCADGHIIEAWETERSATCVEEGEKVGYCTLCGKEVLKIVEASNQHQTTIINAKEATYTEDGYTGDTYCTVCKQTISYGSVIPMLTKPEEPTDPIDPAQPTEPATQPTTQQPQQSGSCRYCGGTHTGFPGVIIGFFHRILALFGLHK